MGPSPVGASLSAIRIQAGSIFAKAANALAALAIKSLAVNGTVRGNEILAGYDGSGSGVNADVQIGKARL